MTKSHFSVHVVTVGVAHARARAVERMRASRPKGIPRAIAGAFAIATVALVVSTSGCTSEEVPADALNGIVRAQLNHDTDALWGRLTPSSQRLLERIAAEDYVANGGGNDRPAKERLFSGGLKFAVGMADYKEVARNGDDALLVATDHEGKQQEVHVRRVDGRWRLQLPGADSANAPDPFAQARIDHANAERM